MMDAHPEVQEQLAIADVVVLTKQDLADSGLLLRAKSLIGTVAPLGVVVDEGDVQRRGTQAMSVIPPAGGSARVLQNCDSLGGRFVVENHQHSAVRSVAFASEGARDHEEFRWRLEQIVYQLGEDLLRMKAIIRVGAGSKALLFQTVGVTFSDPVMTRLEPHSPSVLVFLVRSTFDPMCFGLLNESVWKRQRAQPNISVFYAET
jgi:G3E family GTPase